MTSPCEQCVQAAAERVARALRGPGARVRFSDRLVARAALRSEPLACRKAGQQQPTGLPEHDTEAAR